MYVYSMHTCDNLLIVIRIPHSLCIYRTWGNRATGIDSALNQKGEDQMKRITILINIGLVGLNIAVTAAMLKLFTLGILIQYAVNMTIFIPLLIPLVCACIFFYIVVPLRLFHTRPMSPRGHNSDHHVKGRKTKDTASVSSVRFSEVYCKSEDTWDYI